MPSSTQPYEVLLDFTNDTPDCTTVQLLQDYGRSTAAIVLLQPGETVTLILDAGSVYRYALKMRSKVANVTARSWRDVRCDVSKLFPNGTSSWPPTSGCAVSPTQGITVDRMWRDLRFCMWGDS
ncbi:hypothetical protein JAAARDRAFT_29688 [Jaapia argillacea MUCL 33604]|uniref:Uncharacterized protein n=1 Tax=Jaapia argillacea MUCL 33604 TaxID=933084 RepID=A0A067Q9M5_9AGAM|nr:hypothetical protein JAAARDRAFT_29688 [Jaapia argillacea MUCL 33604]